MSGVNVEGIIKIEGSKSILNRVLIITSILNKPIRIYNYSSCEDIKTMQATLIVMGFDFTVNDYYVEISPSKSIYKDIQLYVQDSATAFRFLMARMAAWPSVKSTIKLSSQLKKRPHKALVDILMRLGADIKHIADRYEIVGRKLTGGVLDIDALMSSQYISALILIAPLFPKGLILNLLDSSVSKGYIEMTISVMKQFGVDVIYNNDQISIAADQKYCASDTYFVEPDFSSSCYFWALGAISPKHITTNYLVDSIQPDHKFINLLKLIGADIQIGESIISIKNHKLSGISIDMNNMPDQVPTLAVLAIFVDSPTTISNIANLRHKESNRLKAIKDEFIKLGVKVDLTKNSMRIIPCKKIIRNVILETYNDHRLVMAFSILEKIIPAISVKSIVAIKKSNPQFFKQLNLIS